MARAHIEDSSNAAALDALLTVARALLTQHHNEEGPVDADPLHAWIDAVAAGSELSFGPAIERATGIPEASWVAHHKSIAEGARAYWTTRHAMHLAHAVATSSGVSEAIVRYQHGMRQALLNYAENVRLGR